MYITKQYDKDIMKYMIIQIWRFIVFLKNHF